MADRNRSTTAAASTSKDFPVFLETKLGSKLVLVVSDNDTVRDLKNKIETEHALTFPDIGEITVHAIEVHWVGSSYRLSNCMLVRKAFDGHDGLRYLYVDARIKDASMDYKTDNIGILSIEHNAQKGNCDLLQIKSGSSHMLVNDPKPTRCSTIDGKSGDSTVAQKGYKVTRATEGHFNVVGNFISEPEKTDAQVEKGVAGLNAQINTDLVFQNQDNRGHELRSHVPDEIEGQCTHSTHGNGKRRNEFLEGDQNGQLSTVKKRLKKKKEKESVNVLTTNSKEAVNDDMYNSEFQDNNCAELISPENKGQNKSKEKTSINKHITAKETETDPVFYKHDLVKVLHERTLENKGEENVLGSTKDQNTSQSGLKMSIPNLSKSKKGKKKSSKTRCEAVKESSLQMNDTGSPLGKGKCNSDAGLSNLLQNKSDVALVAEKQVVDDRKITGNKTEDTELHGANDERSHHLNESIKSSSALSYSFCQTETAMDAVEVTENICQEPSKHASKIPPERLTADIGCEDADRNGICYNNVKEGLKVPFDKKSRLSDKKVTAVESLNSLPQHVTEKNPENLGNHHTPKKRRRKSLKAQCEPVVGTSLQINEMNPSPSKEKCNGEAGSSDLLQNKSDVALVAGKQVDDDRKITGNKTEDTELHGANDERSHHLNESIKSISALSYSFCQTETAMDAVEVTENICQEPSKHASKIPPEKLTADIGCEDADRNGICDNIVKEGLKVPFDKKSRLSDKKVTAVESLNSLPQHVTEKNPENLGNHHTSKKRRKKSSKVQCEPVVGASLQINEMNPSPSKEKCSGEALSSDLLQNKSDVALVAGKKVDDDGKFSENNIGDAELHDANDGSSHHLKETIKSRSALSYSLCQTETAMDALEVTENICQKPPKHASKIPPERLTADIGCEDADRNGICYNNVKEGLKVPFDKKSRLSDKKVTAVESLNSLPQHVTEKNPENLGNHHTPKKRRRKSLKAQCEPVVGTSLQINEMNPSHSKEKCNSEAGSSDLLQNKSDVVLVAGKKVDDDGKFSENNIGDTELRDANDGSSHHLKETIKSRPTFSYNLCQTETDDIALENNENIHQDPSKQASKGCSEKIAAESITEDADQNEICGNLVKECLGIPSDGKSQLSDHEVAAFASLNSLPLHVTDKTPEEQGNNHTSKKRRKKSLKPHREPVLQASLQINEMCPPLTKGNCNDEAGLSDLSHDMSKAALICGKQVDNEDFGEFSENKIGDNELHDANDESSHRLKESMKSKSTFSQNLCQTETAVTVLEGNENIHRDPSKHASENYSEKIAAGPVTKDADRNEMCSSVVKECLGVPYDEKIQMSDPVETASGFLNSLPEHVIDKNPEELHNDHTDLAETSGGNVIIPKVTGPGIPLEDISKVQTYIDRGTQHSRKKSVKTSNKPRNKDTKSEEVVSLQVTKNFFEAPNNLVQDVTTRGAESKETQKKPHGKETEGFNMQLQGSPAYAGKCSSLVDQKNDRKKSHILGKEPSSKKVQTKKSHTKKGYQKEEFGGVFSDSASAEVPQHDKHIKLPHDIKRKASLKSSKIEASVDSEVKASRSKKFDASLVASDESTDDSPTYNTECYRVAVRKVPGRKLEMVSNHKKQTSADMVFDNVSNSGSEDEFDLDNGKLTLKDGHDGLSTSSESDGEVEGMPTTHMRTQVLVGNLGAHVSSADSGRNMKIDNKAAMGSESNKSKLQLGMILRNSSSYKKAKLSQSQYEDEESEPIDFVQETQPELD